MNDAKAPILCLDFDGVCHSYVSGWQGADKINDPPVDGLFEFLEEAKKQFDIVIFSSRSNQPGGIEAMTRWFHKHLNEYIFRTRPELKDKFESFFIDGWVRFVTEKPPAMVTIDDRAITFDGTFPSVASINKFKPWNT